MNIEKKVFEYGKARKRVEKLYPGCKVKGNGNAGIYIEDAQGRNILAQKYPDLAFAGNVMDAFINLDIVSHWNKIETRNSKKFRNDVKTVCVVGDEVCTSSDRMQDYIDYQPDWQTSDGQPEE